MNYRDKGCKKSLISSDNVPISEVKMMRGFQISCVRHTIELPSLPPLTMLGEGATFSLMR
jgi:hypothetical protein